METMQEQLARQEQMMGRPVTWRDAWECVFKGRDGRERVFRVLLYDVDRLEIQGTVVSESRWVAWDGNGSTAGGIIE